MTFINLIQASGKKTRRFGCALLIALIVMQATTQAATITVTGTGDTIAVDGLVTLREAMTSANNDANVNTDVVAVGAYGTDTINFAIVGAGVHTISPTSAFPTITDPIVINGYSQPGSSANTLSVGDNAVLRVEINGTNAPGGAFIVNAAGNTFKGLVINRFFNASFNPGYAFRLMGAGNTIQGCYLGTNPAGDTDLHDTGGVSVEAGGSNLIGGPSAAARALADLLVAFGRDNVAVELWDHGDPLDSARNDALVTIAARAGVDVVATNNVHYDVPSRRRLATALAAVRARRSLDEIDPWLPAGAEARSFVERHGRCARRLPGPRRPGRPGR